MPSVGFLEWISKIDDWNSAKTRISACDCCIYLYLRFYSSFQKLMINTLQKRVFSACLTFANTAYAFICVSNSVYKNWWWKQCKKAFFGMRLLHMPIFAFLKQFSNIDDENRVKTRFSACFTFANAAYALISVSKSSFQKLIMKTV